jgi:hypothetical protein
MKRRTFFQRFGSILAVLGLTEVEWLILGNHYSQALADTVNRKIALLIGINKYLQIPGLSGCLTDVELQRELLIHRFGFQPSDVVCLTDEQATREVIENTFLEHLVKGAQPDDVVFFHFSGYGSRVQLGTLPETIQHALVPVDGDVTSSQENKIVNYLLEETLLLMLQTLTTKHALSVLDTSFYTPVQLLPMGLRSRSRSIQEQATLAPAELEFQLQLQNQVSSKNVFKNQDSRQIILSATSNPKELATEVQLSGVSAGLFTYALTQYLWEATPAKTIQVSLSHVRSTLQQLAIRQQPDLFSKQKNQLPQVQLGDIFLWDSTVKAQGVVIGIDTDGKTAQLWLAGLPLQVLEYYGTNSRLSLISPEGANSQLVVRSRAGLTAKAQLNDPNDTTVLQVGQLVQEAVRVLPRNINLTIALDPGLERIERVDATSAFATVAHTSIGEQAPDYVFAKVPEVNNLVASTSTVVYPSRYGLLSLAGEPIPNASGGLGEAVKVSVKQITPRLEALLAAKTWRLTENAASSRLKVKAALEIIDKSSSQTLTEQETFVTQQKEQLVGKDNSKLGVSSIPIGSRIQYQVENLSDRPLYIMLLGLNSSKTAIALCPWLKTTTSDGSQAPQMKDVVIAPGETRTIPQTDNGFAWIMQGSAAVNETQLIFSTSPFTQTQVALEVGKHPTTERNCIQPLINSLDVAKAVLQDLHNASTANEANATSTDSYILDVNHWASLSFVHQLI